MLVEHDLVVIGKAESNPVVDSPWRSEQVCRMVRCDSRAPGHSSDEHGHIYRGLRPIATFSCLIGPGVRIVGQVVVRLHVIVRRKEGTAAKIDSAVHRQSVEENDFSRGKVSGLAQGQVQKELNPPTILSKTRTANLRGAVPDLI